MLEIFLIHVVLLIPFLAVLLYLIIEFKKDYDKVILVLIICQSFLIICFIVAAVTGNIVYYE